MDDDSKEKDELDELKGEVLLPEVEDELPTDEEDDLLLHKHHKKLHEDDVEDDSLDALADEELGEEDEPYDDVDQW